MRVKKVKLKKSVIQFLKDNVGLFNSERETMDETVVSKMLLYGDYIRAKLNILDYNFLFDHNKGLWEIYPLEEENDDEYIEFGLTHGWEAKNPEADTLTGEVAQVAIDFGTSSTVVAVRCDGKTELVRVGISDLTQSPTSKDYENPSILEFVNFPNVMKAWFLETYKPPVLWDDFHFSHEALEHLRNNNADARMVSSIVTHLKQFPLLKTSYLITDQREGQFDVFEIPPVEERYNVKGQPIDINDDYPLDPIELYAYYLGLFINHRNRGLFLQYYITFPVGYCQDVKRKILASFSRGLQRSLPKGLTKSLLFYEFSVDEIASEPASYAACALDAFKIPLTSEGVPFGVFDFGGGTTDYIFGLYRSPDREEEDEGYEKVLEELGLNGDNTLGGEIIISHLAYLTFLYNQEQCREKRIPFTRPYDADRFPGDEFLVDKSTFAKTNTILVMSALRPIWEKFGDIPYDGKGTFNTVLLNSRGEKQEFEFTIEHKQLNDWLINRVLNGIEKFFIALKEVFGRCPSIKNVCIFLAGNCCKSFLVQTLFKELLSKNSGDDVFDVLEEDIFHENIRIVDDGMDILDEDLNMLEEKIDIPDSVSSINQETALKKYINESKDFSRIKSAIKDLDYKLYLPLENSPGEPYSPNAKTGVAIGLLKFIPGESLKYISLSQQNEGEAPFSYFTGKFVSGVFHPLINKNDHYGDWIEFGPPPGGVFTFVYSASPLSITKALKRGDKDLKERKLRLGDDYKGKKVFARAVSPDLIEICLAKSIDDIDGGDGSSIQKMILN